MGSKHLTCWRGAEDRKETAPLQGVEVCLRPIWPCIWWGCLSLYTSFQLDFERVIGTGLGLQYVADVIEA